MRGTRVKLWKQLCDEVQTNQISNALLRFFFLKGVPQAESNQVEVQANWTGQAEFTEEQETIDRQIE